jgi:hypothetical protein
MKRDQVACEGDINDKSNIKTEISHLYSCRCSSFGLGLFNNRRLSWCQGIIVLLNTGLREKEIVQRGSDDTLETFTHL